MTLFLFFFLFFFVLLYFSNSFLFSTSSFGLHFSDTVDGLKFGTFFPHNTCIAYRDSMDLHAQTVSRFPLMSRFYLGNVIYLLAENLETYLALLYFINIIPMTLLN